MVSAIQPTFRLLAASFSSPTFPLFKQTALCSKFIWMKSRVGNKMYVECRQARVKVKVECLLKRGNEKNKIKICKTFKHIINKKKTIRNKYLLEDNESL